MHLRIFAEDNYGNLERVVNDFLRGLPKSDIVKIESHEGRNYLSVFIWLSVDAPTKEKQEDEG